MIDHLFVYGTLMRAASRSELGRNMRERLECEATWLGPATIAGCLYDLGAYPALVEPAQPADLVLGEVWRLADPAATFEWLDPYEGLEIGKLTGEEYVRCVNRVTLQSGRSQDAQVYLFVGPFSHALPVPDGRWHPPKD